MPLSVRGTDAEFKFKLGDEITYSVNNKDYTVMSRKVIARMNLKIYLLRACDPTNETQQLQLNLTDEDKMTITDCLSVFSKVWPNLTQTGTNEEFMNYILNNVLGKICDIKEGVSHAVTFENGSGPFKMTFEGVEFTK
tara:strand:+ start:257 stop:670 length:414 start_codon:yes stop_codon:yes gene_type:complete